MIVIDTMEVQNKVSKVIEILDTQTPQILIQTKIVEARETYSRTIGIDENFNFEFRFAGDFENDKSGIVGVSPIAGVFNIEAQAVSDKINTIEAQLYVQEQEGNLEVVSSPKLITQNNQTATLNTQETINDTLDSPASGDGADPTQTVNSTVLPTNISVTPKVTADGSIDMDITVQRTSTLPGSATEDVPSTEETNIKSRILVGNGGTAVLGGFHSNNEQTTEETGMPLLRKIPILGFFFRSPKGTSRSKKEILIFISPRILNPEEAGFASENLELDLPDFDEVEKNENEASGRG